MTEFVRLEALAVDAEAAERAVAEAFAAGASGIEERVDSAGVMLIVYAPADAGASVGRAVGCCAGVSRTSSPEAVEDIDWSEHWKQRLEAVEVSPRLVVRPSFVGSHSREGQAELVIDPGQAFGTGGHASTLLALEWIDQLAPNLVAGARVLDVGAGTGVLALAALRLGAARAVAFDLDPLSAPAVLENAARNGLDERLAVFTGTLDALAGAPFDLVAANLLRRELLPIVDGIAAATAPGGFAVFSGLLAEEQSRVEAALAEVGLTALGVRHRAVPDAEHWIGLLTRR